MICGVIRAAIYGEVPRSLRDAFYINGSVVCHGRPEDLTYPCTHSVKTTLVSLVYWAFKQEMVVFIRNSNINLISAFVHKNLADINNKH